jgi:hypothetical protein
VPTDYARTQRGGQKENRQILGVFSDRQLRRGTGTCAFSKTDKGSMEAKELPFQSPPAYFDYSLKNELNNVHSSKLTEKLSYPT